MIFPLKCAYCFAESGCTAGPAAVTSFDGTLMCVPHFQQHALPKIAPPRDFAGEHDADRAAQRRALAIEGLTDDLD